MVFKLVVVVELYNPGPTTDYRELWGRGSTWSTVEHGLSLFAASVLAVGPICGPVVQGWTSFSGSISRHYGMRRDSLPFSNIFRRNRKQAEHDNIWGWASRRNSDRELVNHAAMPGAARVRGGESRGESRGTLDSINLHLSLPPSFSQRASKPFDWDHWSKFADGHRSLHLERSPSYRESVPPDVRPGTSGSFKEEATEGGKFDPSAA